MVKKTDRKMERTRRHLRVRRKISGTAERPRLCVYRSNANLYVQVIDDVAGNTLAQASTLDKEVKVKLYENNNVFKEVKTLNPTNQNYQFVCFLYKLPEQTERLINLHLKISSRYKVKIYDYELIDKIEKDIKKREKEA